MTDKKQPVAVLFPIAKAQAEKNVARASERTAQAGGMAALNAALFDAIRPPQALVQQVAKLRFLATRWSQLLAPDAACRAGCAHCCHINVDVPRVEARMIARGLGVKLKTPPVLRELTDKAPAEGQHFGRPCVFLNPTGAGADGRGGYCSIYRMRPMACRLLLNMADDAQLCELRPGESVPVPYANSTTLMAAFALVTRDEPVADIREWFDPLPGAGGDDGK